MREAFLAEKEAEIDEVTGELEIQITGAKEKLKEAKKICEELEANHPEAKAAAKKFLSAMGKVVEPDEDVLEAIDNAITELEGIIAQAKETETVTIPHAQEIIDKLQAAIEVTRKAAKKLAPYGETAIEESQPVIDAMFAVYDAMKVLVGQGANAAALELQSALNQMASSVVNYVEAVTGKRSERLDALAAKTKAKLNEMYIDTTQGNLDCVELNKVVALGDKNAYGPAADIVGGKVAGFMGEGNYTYKNMTVAGQTAIQLRTNLSKYAEELKDASVITLAFSVNSFSKYAVEKVVNEGVCDWGMYIGDGNAAKIEEAKADLYAKLEARGYAQVDALVRMAESYVFSYMQHILSYYPLIRDIHAMNPDAHIVMVGMHNPLEGHTAEIYGVELPLGDVFRYMADIANIYALSYAMLSENKLFVDAFEIDVNNEGAYYEHVPTEEGYAEIAENIWEALGVHDHQWVHVGDSEERIDAHTIKIHHKYECSVCGAVRYEDENKTGDLIGIVLVTLAVSGMGITVLKRREF
jgi:lysophospholipase L1-like esterase/ribosome-associated translation inhibitor RaiA